MHFFRAVDKKYCGNRQDRVEPFIPSIIVDVFIDMYVFECALYFQEKERVSGMYSVMTKIDQRIFRTEAMGTLPVINTINTKKMFKS